MRGGETRLRRQRVHAASRAVEAEQAREQALGKEGRLRLAGVLPMNHPRLQRPGAHRDHVELAAVQALAQRADAQPRRARRRRAPRHQLALPLPRVQVEVGEVCRGLRGRVPPLPAQRASCLVVLCVGHAAPALLVVRDADLAPFPCLRIGALAGVVDDIRDERLFVLLRVERGPEGKPLHVALLLDLRARVRHHVQTHCLAKHLHQPDVACIKVAGDGRAGHGSSSRRVAHAQQ